MNNDLKKAGATFLKSLAVMTIAGVIAAQFVGVRNVSIVFCVEACVGLGLKMLFDLQKASGEEE